MPSLILSISGVDVSVAGAIFLNGVVSEQLMNTVSLVPAASNAVSDNYPSAWHTHAVFIAHTFRCLRLCFDDLAKYYRDMKPSTPPDDQLCPAPHFTSFISELNKQITLKYRKSIFPSVSSRTVFEADWCVKGEEQKRCAVKFTTRYSRKAHELMGDCAPKLLHCRWEPTVGQYCVVTEFIDDSGDRRPTPEGLEELRGALTNMHTSDYVHGDLREPNIVIDENGRAYVIDFDWAGKKGSVVYPIGINKDIEWAEGVKGGVQIEQKHDEEMLEKYIEKYPVASEDA